MNIIWCYFMPKIKFKEEKKAIESFKKLYKLKKNDYLVDNQGHVFSITLHKKYHEGLKRLEGLEKFPHLKRLDLSYFYRHIQNLESLINLDLNNLAIDLRPKQAEANIDTIKKIKEKKPEFKFIVIIGHPQESY